MTSPISFVERKFIPVDEWIPKPEEIIIKECKGAIVMPISEYFGIKDVPSLDYFILKSKRCYNGPKFRPHNAHYLNYFLNFYDMDKELIMIYAKLKYMIDYESDYSEQAFMYDIAKYLLSPSIVYKVDLMNRDNYKLKLNYKNKKDVALQYTTQHGYIMMKISILMNILIPIVCHFIYENKMTNSNDFILAAYDIIFSMFKVDIYSKIYETASSNIIKSRKNDSILWDMQPIRGKNTTTHTIEAVVNIILNLMPKYNYDKNIITYNYVSVKRIIRYQITDINYGYSFIPLSSSNRDEDMHSEFDKFESFMITQDESLYLQNRVNCDETMKRIELLYGPFSDDEIAFYLEKDDLMNDFRKELIFNLFYKYFGDPVSIRNINKIQYVKLLLAAKTILQINHMVLLPYVITSKILRLVGRKNLNKKEYAKTISSELFQFIKNKYKSEKIEKYIISQIATILSSDFEIVDFYDDDLDGQPLEIIPDIIREEIMLYVTLI